MKTGVPPRAYRAPSFVSPNSSSNVGRVYYRPSSKYAELVSTAVEECDDPAERERELALRERLDSRPKKSVVRNSSSKGLASKL